VSRSSRYSGSGIPAFALLLVVLALSTAACAQAEARPRGTLFHLIGTRTYTPYVNAAHVTLRLPLQVRADVSIRDIRPEIADVESPGRREPSLFDAFTVAMAGQPSRQARAPALLLTIKEPLAPGTYRVRFTLLSGHPARRQGMTIRVLLPAPQLAVPPTIYITRTIDSPIKVRNSGLVLRETSGHARLAGLSVEQVQGPGGVDQLADGKVIVPTPKPVAPGTSAIANVSTEGDFPLGTSTGQLEIYSPQLGQAIPVTYQVQTRRWKLWLVVAIVLGVAFGFLTRVWLVQRIQRGKARVQAYGVLDQLAQERQRRTDPAFTASIDEARQMLERVLRAGTPEEITAAVKDAGDKLQDAHKKLEEDLGKARDQLVALQQVLATQGSLPNSVSAILDAQRNPFAAIQRQLEAGDAKGVSEAAEEMQSELDREVRRATEQWRTEVRPFLSTLQGEGPTVLGSANPGLMTSAADAASLVEGSAFTQQNASLESVLSALATAVVAVTGAVNQLRPVVGTIAQTIRILESDALPGQRARPELRANVQEFSSAMQSADPREASTLQALERTLRSLSTQLTEMIKDKDKSNVSEIQSALDSGHFESAARVAVADDRPGVDAALAEAVTAPSALGLEDPGMADALARANTTVAAVNVVAERPWTVGPVLRAADFSDSPAVLQPQAFKQLAMDQGILTALLGVVVVIVGYFLFTDNFVGTTSDLLTAFGWGYTADITSAFVVGALSGKTTAPAAAPPAPGAVAG
jgi:hypothetical protein